MVNGGRIKITKQVVSSQKSEFRRKKNSKKLDLLTSSMLNTYVKFPKKISIEPNPSSGLFLSLKKEGIKGCVFSCERVSEFFLRFAFF
jgi:hypothetical protein